MSKPGHERHVFNRREMPCDRDSLLPNSEGQAIVAGKLDQKASRPQHRPCPFNWYGHEELPLLERDSVLRDRLAKRELHCHFLGDCVSAQAENRSCRLMPRRSYVFGPVCVYFLKQKSSIWPNYAFETRPIYGFLHTVLGQNSIRKRMQVDAIGAIRRTPDLAAGTTDQLVAIQAKQVSSAAFTRTIGTPGSSTPRSCWDGR